MRKSFLLYLFVFTILLAVIIYSNSSRIVESQKEEIEKLKEDILSSERERDSLLNQNLSLQTFSLISNEEAISYFESFGLSYEEVVSLLEEEIIGRNLADADNELIPYEGMEGHFRINKIRILNHKWAIAEFSDGTYWGEVFLTYFFDENNELEVTTENALLYPLN